MFLFYLKLNLQLIMGKQFSKSNIRLLSVTISITSALLIGNYLF